MASPRASASAELPVTCHCQALRQAARQTTGLYDAMMAPFGLRISQYAILARLREFGPVGLQVLAAGLVLDRTTLGRSLLPLERDGLVASESNPLDRRMRRLVLTDAGMAMLQQAKPAWRQAQEAFEAQVGSVQATALQQELHRMTAVLQGLEPRPVG